MDLYKNVGCAIRNIRLEKELSQIIVSNRSGTNHSYYCEIERGAANPSLKKLYAIIQALGISLSEFVDAISRVEEEDSAHPGTEGAPE